MILIGRHTRRNRKTFAENPEFAAEQGRKSGNTPHRKPTETGGLKADGTPDMRVKHHDESAEGDDEEAAHETRGTGAHRKPTEEGGLKADGTPDMRVKGNKDQQE